MATDVPSAFKDKSCIKMVGYDMTKKAADQVYKEAGELLLPLYEIKHTIDMKLGDLINELA